MTRDALLRVATHNQGDRAASPDHGWDVQCLTERSPGPGPVWARRHTARGIKGLAIDHDPRVLRSVARGSALAHLGVPRLTPARGTLWECYRHVPTGRRVAVVCDHRINDPRGRVRALPLVRWSLWRLHRLVTRRVIRRLQRRGYAVFYGGDPNHASDPIRPLRRVLRGRKDALAGPRLGWVTFLRVHRTEGAPSDHDRYTAVWKLQGA